MCWTARHIHGRPVSGNLLGTPRAKAMGMIRAHVLDAAVPGPPRFTPVCLFMHMDRPANKQQALSCLTHEAARRLADAIGCPRTEGERGRTPEVRIAVGTVVLAWRAGCCGLCLYGSRGRSCLGVVDAIHTTTLTWNLVCTARTYLVWSVFCSCRGVPKLRQPSETRLDSVPQGIRPKTEHRHTMTTAYIH
jgi:hypothetical protein